MSKALKFGSRLKELRIHLCQAGESSKGVREFIESSYVGIKSSNPKTPILIRECSGVSPRVWARFEKGKEQSVCLKGLACDDVFSRIKSLAA